MTTALARAAELLRQARRELEAAISEVPGPYAWDVRHLAAQASYLRVRVQDLRHAVGDRDQTAEAEGA